MKKERTKKAFFRSSPFLRSTNGEVTGTKGVTEARPKGVTEGFFLRNYSNGTPGICFAVRIVKLVFTLATFGAGVSFEVRNS